MDELNALATELREQLGPAPVETDAQWRRLQRDARFQSPRRFERRHWTLGLAFGFAAVVLCVVLTRVPFGNGFEQLSSSSAPESFRLADGSALVLERESRGELRENEQGTSFLLDSGRVRLEVAPQHGRSFEVRARGYAVTVVGTRFDVSLGASGGVAVEVAHGVVEVKPPGAGSTVRLLAGDRLDGDADGKVTVHHKRTQPSAISHAAETSGEASAPSAAAPGSSGAERVIEAPAPQRSAAITSPLSAADWRALFQERRYPEALASARTFGMERLLKELDARALSDLADTARLAGDASLGVRVLETLRARFPGGAQASRAAFLLGRAHALSGNRKGAISAFEAHLAKDPNGPHSTEALGRLMELYSVQGDRSRARTAAEHYLERAPKGPYERLARSLVAR
jgi:TolA-binding protein